MKRKILTFILMIIFLIASYNIVYASTLKISLSLDKQSVEKDSNVVLTVDWKEKMQAADYIITYDSSKLQYVSSSIEATYINTSTAGKIGVSWFSSNNTDLTKMTFTFKSIAEGSANISVAVDGGFSDGNMNIPESYDVATSGKASLTIKEVEDKKEENKQEENKQENTSKTDDEKKEETNSGAQSNEQSKTDNVQEQSEKNSTKTVQDISTSKSKQDTTTSTKILPKTGDNFAICIISGIILIAFGITLFKNYNKYRGL